MKQLAPLEGYNLSALGDVRFLRCNRPLSRTPVLYDPGIVILCQGRKRGHLGDELYLYDAHHYLVVSVPVPFTMETDASEAEPMLAIYMHLDFTLAGELMLEIADAAALEPAEPKGMYASPMDEPLSKTTLRFLEAMSDPLEARVLGPTLVREIYYRIATGEQGGSLRAALAQQGAFGKVVQAIRRIHTSYAQRLDVSTLALEAGMSAPSFYRHFRLVTRSTPMQYLKSTRLHQARLLMLRHDITAAAAGFEVGYQSPSQFSRDFKRFFGRTPQAEVQWMQDTYVLPAPTEPSIYVSSH
ncbi:AraC family transcriptional regulator [Stutzerimonas azotifigens]|nr:AraC family transcriptional regulator [Stutzerimonas azotifigens]